MKKKTQEKLDKEVEEVVRAFEEAGLTEENLKRNREEWLRHHGVLIK